MTPASSEELGQRLSALLLKKESATAALQELCAHPIHAVMATDTSLPDQSLTPLLGLSPEQSADMSIRHVYLMCGTTQLSEAWNIYVPNRLTKEARLALTDQHTPFGRAVGNNFFWRERLSSRLNNLSEGMILENRALLRRKKDDMPIAAVLERYTAAVLQR